MSQRLFMAVPTSFARQVATGGFVGENCEFRDRPPVGLTFSLTTEAHVEVQDGDEVGLTIGGGPVLADDLGDFVLSIEVPDDMREYEVHEDPPMGWPFREYWLPPDVANSYRQTLEVWVPETEEQIPIEVLRQDHAVIITERFGFAFDTEPPQGAAAALESALAGEELTPEQIEILEVVSAAPTNPVGARCTCGSRWRWSGEGDPALAIDGSGVSFAQWSENHHESDEP